MGKTDPEALATTVAAHFGGNQHGIHGRRIDRDEARQQQLQVIDLEDDQRLQEEVLTLYHLSTIAFLIPYYRHPRPADRC